MRAKTGYINISNLMREKKGVMGGELSGHYSYRDNAYADSGFISFVILLQVLSEHNKSLSEIVSPFHKYYKAHEINIEVEDAEALIRKIKEEFKEAKQDELDGITIEFEKWWFNVRSSNTEPLVRITIEGETEEIMEKEKDKLISFINKNL